MRNGGIFGAKLGLQLHDGVSIRIEFLRCDVSHSWSFSFPSVGLSVHLPSASHQNCGSQSSTLWLLHPHYVKRQKDFFSHNHMPFRRGGVRPSFSFSFLSSHSEKSEKCNGILEYAGKVPLFIPVIFVEQALIYSPISHSFPFFTHFPSNQLAFANSQKNE